MAMTTTTTLATHLKDHQTIEEMMIEMIEEETVPAAVSKVTEMKAPVVVNKDMEMIVMEEEMTTIIEETREDSQDMEMIEEMIMTIEETKADNRVMAVVEETMIMADKMTEETTIMVNNKAMVDGIQMRVDRMILDSVMAREVVNKVITAVVMLVAIHQAMMNSVLLLNMLRTVAHKKLTCSVQQCHS